MIFEFEISNKAIEEDPDLLKYAKAIQFLANRMSMSHFKYGNMADKYPDYAKAIDSAYKREEMYAKTGNTENCLDAANFHVIEYLFPSHPKGHFKAQSSAQSPGLVYRED